ncbi:hypothetical protein J5Y04_13750 [Kitasatospora sp. RG8]|uniref:hypothetical protein n=1 Tax=Kitasatospora sp. RG8 TaxID=2820815 RepID=UPI001AE08C27|nr:hypothetical protein [Kitasatospora sp. RG8]MBP0450600.1 hypothetical protein [Kitasatospora sp. RG8]
MSNARPVMAGDERTSPGPTLTRARARAGFEADLPELPPAARRIEVPAPPAAVVSERLLRHTADVRRRIEERLRAAAGRSCRTRRTDLASPHGDSG